MPRARKSGLVIATDFFGFAVCTLASFWILNLAGPSIWQMSAVAFLLSIIAIEAGWLQGVYRSVTRYMGVDLLFVAFRTSLGSSVAGAAIVGVSGLSAAPIRWGMLFFAYSLIYVISSRFIASFLLIDRGSRKKREKIIVYGAGAAGAHLIASLHASEKFVPVALVDDDTRLHGERIKGLEVYSSLALGEVISKLGADRVLLALPSATRRRRRQVLERLSEHPVHVQTIPDIGDIISGKARVDDVSDVDVEDLLGRDSVPPKKELIDASTQNKTVLVTGAGGSIGSELCRQILSRSPKRLILLELNEAALYSIDRELTTLCKKSNFETEIYALLGSVHHEDRIREILTTLDVDTIYHAAAYKHVPIVEHNIFEGIHNNVFGTLHTARAAIDCDIETFVLVSTDKAVNPTSVMGATKRMSELILQALNSESSNTKFCMVRFGNVLESSGSVVPLFRDQIRSGGPITVTHRDIIRYFMTIPEAAQLVIQAAALAKGGDVFVLDMGKPVKIHDLAIRMVNLMGLTVRDEANPDGDIDIEYIGLRPAEKLYEELLIGSNVAGTEHPRIMRADEDFLPISALREILDELKFASNELDYDRARNLLLRGVKEYQPENGIDDLLWLQKNGEVTSTSDDRIVDFPVRPA